MFFSYFLCAAWEDPFFSSEGPSDSVWDEREAADIKWKNSLSSCVCSVWTVLQIKLKIKTMVVLSGFTFSCWQSSTSNSSRSASISSITFLTGCLVVERLKLNKVICFHQLFAIILSLPNATFKESTSKVTRSDVTVTTEDRSHTTFSFGCC